MVLADLQQIGFPGTRLWHERSDHFRRTSAEYEICHRSVLSTVEHMSRLPIEQQLDCFDRVVYDFGKACRSPPQLFNDTNESVE